MSEQDYFKFGKSRFRQCVFVIVLALFCIFLCIFSFCICIYDFVLKCNPAEYRNLFWICPSKLCWTLILKVNKYTALNVRIFCCDKIIYYKIKCVCLVCYFVVFQEFLNFNLVLLSFLQYVHDKLIN